MKIFNKKTARLLLVIFFISFLFVGSASAWVLGEPIVPCGGLVVPEGGGTPVAQPPCTQCELLHLVDNIADFIMIALAPALATLFFVIAGVYIMLGGANPGMLSQGKRIFTEALVGLLIVMLAWLFTNVLITTLVRDSFNIYPDGFDFDSADWWQLTCEDLYLDTEPPRGSSGGSGGSGGGGGGGAIIISGQSIYGISQTFLSIRWNTNVAGSSVAEFRQPGVQAWTPVPAYEGNVTQHNVTITQLQPNTAYEVRAVSVEPNSGYRAVGSTLTTRTNP